MYKCLKTNCATNALYHINKNLTWLNKKGIIANKLQKYILQEPFTKPTNLKIKFIILSPDVSGAF